jgi:hypothetical protein
LLRVGGLARQREDRVVESEHRDLIARRQRAEEFLDRVLHLRHRVLHAGAHIDRQHEVERDVLRHEVRNRLRLAVLEHAERAARQSADVFVLAVGHRHGHLHDLDVHGFGEAEALGDDGVDDTDAGPGGDGAYLMLRDRLSDVELAFEGCLRRPAHLPAVDEERHRHGGVRRRHLCAQHRRSTHDAVFFRRHDFHADVRRGVLNGRPQRGQQHERESGFHLCLPSGPPLARSGASGPSVVSAAM